MTPEQIQLLSEWQAAQQDLAIAKSIIDKEMTLRKAVVASFWPTPKEGVNNMELNAGWKMKYNRSLEYKVDDAALPACREALFVANVSSDKLFKLTPSLSVTEYRLLDDNIRSIVDKVLTIKPKSPTLELIPPKES